MYKNSYSFFEFPSVSIFLSTRNMARSPDNFISLFTHSEFLPPERPSSPDLNISERSLKYFLSLNSPDYNS